MKKQILVTGGAGFIGSHTCVELIKEGYEPVIFDNLYNSSAAAVKRVGKITGMEPELVTGDLLDKKALEHVFAAHAFDAVIHFAGLKAVGESTRKPLEYYSNNITGTLNLLFAMREAGCKKIVFSSSATVYGDPAFVPITEECPPGERTNPYGETKAMIERILTDLAKAEPEWNIILLRYFNPIGAHESGLIGEDPKGIPNNLVPYVAKVAAGQLEKVHVFGNDYPTPDGTGVRDYIHVVDLARGHICALKAMESTVNTKPEDAAQKDCAKGAPAKAAGGLKGVNVFNLGTGTGYSVLDIIKAYENACGKPIPYVIEGRRPGDIAVCYADPAKAERVLGWKAEKGIEEMCADSWRFQSSNPEGYAGAEE